MSKSSNIVTQIFEHIAAMFKPSDFDTASAAAAVDVVLEIVAEVKCLEINFRH